MDILKNITLASQIKIGDTCSGLFFFDEKAKYGSYKNMSVSKIKETKTGIKVYFSGTFVFKGEEKPSIDHYAGFSKKNLPWWRS